VEDLNQEGTVEVLTRLFVTAIYAGIYFRNHRLVATRCFETIVVKLGVRCDRGRWKRPCNAGCMGSLKSCSERIKWLPGLEYRSTFSKAVSLLAEWCPASTTWKRVSRFRLDTTEPEVTSLHYRVGGDEKRPVHQETGKAFSLIDTERLVPVPMKGRPLVWKTSLLHCYAKVGDADGYGEVRSAASCFLLC
jgi:hypothetical protein